MITRKEPRQKQLFCLEKMLFLLIVGFSIITTFFVTKNCLDSDASSELILAKHLSETGQILSTDWIYSTELRVLNTQLVYAPLFLIFSSWHLVRFLGAILLQAILIFSFYIFTHLLGINKKSFYLCAALFLLPISVCWGRIVLYHCYYVPHISLSLVIVGLIFSGKYNIKTLLPLFVLSFIGGLGGIRQLLITHVPALLAVFIYWAINDFLRGDKQENFFKTKWPLILTAVFSTGMSGIGYLINKFFLAQKYVFRDYTYSTISLLDGQSLDDVLYAFFHHFGFRDQIALLSPLGILSVLGIFLGIYGVILSILKILECRKHGCIKKTLPYTFFISHIVVLLFSFLVLGDGYYFVLYLVPMVIWMIPVFVFQLPETPKNVDIFHLKKLIPYLAVILIFVNGIANSGYFYGVDLLTQKYEGLSYQNKNQKQDMQPVVDFLRREQYTLGYATFWNCNIITEITDGNIKMILVTIDPQDGTTKFDDWLTLKSNRELQNQKEFLLIETYLKEVFEKDKNLENHTIVYEDDLFVVYSIPPKE